MSRNGGDVNLPPRTAAKPGKAGRLSTEKPNCGDDIMDCYVRIVNKGFVNQKPSTIIVI